MKGVIYIPREIQERGFGDFQLERVCQDPPTLLYDVIERLVDSYLGSRWRLRRTHLNSGSTPVVMQNR